MILGGREINPNCTWTLPQKRRSEHRVELRETNGTVFGTSVSALRPSTRDPCPRFLFLDFFGTRASSWNARVPHSAPSPRLRCCYCCCCCCCCCCFFFFLLPPSSSGSSPLISGASSSAKPRAAAPHPWRSVILPRCQRACLSGTTVPEPAELGEDLHFFYYLLTLPMYIHSRMREIDLRISRGSF